MRKIERGLKSLKLTDNWRTRISIIGESFRKTQEAKALRQITFDPTDIKISFITTDSVTKQQVTVGCLNNGKFFWSEQQNKVSSGFEIDEEEVRYRFNPGSNFFRSASRK